MNKIIISLILILGTLLEACEKIGLCDDAEFNFPKQENASNKIRLNGYYYGDLTGKNPDNPKAYLFYQNGVGYSKFTSYKLEDIESNSLDISISEDNRNNIKSGWGIYKIEKSLIEIQNWTFSTGCKPIIVQKGEILNDTTIRITSWKNSNSNELHNVNAIFRFKEYFSKPDSTNNFIK